MPWLCARMCLCVCVRARAINPCNLQSIKLQSTAEISQRTESHLIVFELCSQKQHHFKLYSILGAQLLLFFPPCYCVNCFNRMLLCILRLEQLSFAFRTDTPSHENALFKRTNFISRIINRFSLFFSNAVLLQWVCVCVCRFWVAMFVFNHAQYTNEWTTLATGSMECSLSLMFIFVNDLIMVHGFRRLTRLAARFDPVPHRWYILILIKITMQRYLT